MSSAIIAESNKEKRETVSRWSVLEERQRRQNARSKQVLEEPPTDFSFQQKELNMPDSMFSSCQWRRRTSSISSKSINGGTRCS